MKHFMILAFVAAHAVASEQFVPAAALVRSDINHPAILMKDGRVLLTGGIGNLPGGTYGTTEKAQIYDPATQQFRPTAGDLVLGRNSHCMANLPDGRVLIAGGQGENGGLGVLPAEVYDPRTDQFTLVGSVNERRVECSASVLPDGKVLIVSVAGAKTAELFDPSTGTFSYTGSLHVAPSWVTSISLSDGRVFVTSDAPNAEIYDPAAGTFSRSGPEIGGLYRPQAQLLSDGRVFVIGPSLWNNDGSKYTIAEIYDPATNSFSPGVKTLENRGDFCSGVLNDGRVLVAGGMGDWFDQPGKLASAEIFNPSTNLFMKTANLNEARSECLSVSLSDGSVLVMGGRAENQGQLVSTEMFVGQP